MAIDLISAAPAGIGSPAQLATGAFTGSGNGASIGVGFNPRHFILQDETGNIRYEKMQGTPGNTTYKSVAAGTTTIDTTSLVTFPADAGLNEPGSSVLLAASICTASSKFVWACYG
jgi:hypothetical protein